MQNTHKDIYKRSLNKCLVKVTKIELFILQEEDNRTVSICESIASTVTAPDIDDEPPSSMDEDDDADSDTTSAPSPSSLRIEDGGYNH